ncbi:PQQ-binding-like beta-propeller repeat protein [bacterium]|nr:PQQ-binding-like beta-propeller repeat protein [bacterium]
MAAVILLSAACGSGGGDFVTVTEQFSTPHLLADGDMLVANRSVLRRLSPELEPRWSYTPPVHDLRPSLASSPDGSALLVYGIEAQRLPAAAPRAVNIADVPDPLAWDLYMIDPSGQVEWSRRIPNPTDAYKDYSNLQLLLPDGGVLFGFSDYRGAGSDAPTYLSRLDSDGEVLWESQRDDNRCPDVLNSAGQLCRMEVRFAGPLDSSEISRLVALDTQSGTELWSRDEADLNAVSLYPGTGAADLIVARFDRIEAIDSAGQSLWIFELEGAETGSTVVPASVLCDPAGFIWVSGPGSHSLWRLDASGAVVAEAQSPLELAGLKALCAGGGALVQAIPETFPTFVRTMLAFGADGTLLRQTDIGPDAKERFEETLADGQGRLVSRGTSMGTSIAQSASFIAVYSESGELLQRFDSPDRRRVPADDGSDTDLL